MPSSHSDSRTPSPAPVERPSALMPSLFVAFAIGAPAVLAGNLAFTVIDPDVWWHATTGQWIVEHGEVPSADPFSAMGPDASFVAYSWLPELMLHGLNALFGLKGFGVFTALLVAAIGGALYRLLRGVGADVAPACVFQLAAMTGMILCSTPRPWLFTILFFIVELDILLSAGRTGKTRRLLWIPLILCIWANCHIQFVGGLAILAAAVVESFIASRYKNPFVTDDASAIRWTTLLGVFVLSTLATLVNPYGVGIYATAHLLISQKELWQYIFELQAMPFRHISHWMVLVLSGAAIYALGKRRQVRPLVVLLLLGGIYLGFKSRRDVWIPVVMSAVVLAETFPSFSVSAVKEKAHRGMVAAMLVCVGLMFLLVLQRPNETLEGLVRKDYPVDAVRFIKQEKLEGPLYNHYDWGGFLIYHLPELPVSVDGRTIVHGERRVIDATNTFHAKEGWEEDADLLKSKVVLLPAESSLARALGCDARFKEAYSDDVAKVFVATGLGAEQ